MSHRAAAAIPLVLIALCAAAFLRAEQLKLHHSAVGHPHVRQAFSPGCTDPGCLPVAKLRFTLRKPQALGLAIVDADGDVTKTLAIRRPYPKGPVVLRWDGSTNAGAQAPDGRYRLRVTLADGREVTIPDAIIVDTVAPTIRIDQVHKGRVALAVHYTRSHGNGYALMIVRQGRRIVLQKRVVPHVAHLAFGKVAPGRYRIEMVAVDQAGNRTPNPPSFPATIP
ncbi:MAG TPA: FlgD immunoglobulin-like domain containing protein [Gaiellales bacterium]|nr:FlgD immunoglobulin-like domain containing protein [Gaiellales bacterium]